MEAYQKPLFTEEIFKNQSFIITGGGTGLGKSMAKYLLSLGGNVIIASRKLEVLEKTADELNQNNKTSGKVLALSCDVRKYEEVEKLIATGTKEFGQINGLINNAAGNFISPTERLSAKAFDTIVDIVLKGSYNCSLAMGKEWIKNQQKGNFLNIITTYSYTGSGYVVPSAAAKGGVLALTKSLAAEWAKYGIRSNAIAPGPFPTPGAFSRLFPKEVAEKIDPLKRIPIKRFGDHQELANLAAYLLSDFSSYINGEVITIDAGEAIYNAGMFNGFDAIPKESWDIIESQTKK